LYGATCERFGVDPAADIADTVLAHNFRVALMLRDAPDRDEQDAAKLDQDRAAIRALERSVP
jgi:hypothetical protein